MAHCIIYIPGIGDHRSYGQDIALNLWRLFGLKPYYLPLGWRHKEGFEAKLERLLTLIKELESEGNTVSLVGVSAGASAVLSAFANHPSLNKVICICGKINNPQTIGKRTFEQNPDFEESMKLLEVSMNSLDTKERKRIMSIHPWRDQVVPNADTIIEGAREVTMPGWSHSTGIFFGVILGSYKIAKFVRN